jgi:MFS transporter, DHA1 family, multidrug resistance protein
MLRRWGRDSRPSHLRDLAEGPVAQRTIAQVMMIFAVSPAIAPIAGAFLCGFGGWRSVFWAVGVFAGLLLLIAGLTLPVGHRHRLNFGSLLQTYRRISLDHRFMLLSMSTALNFGSLFLYISSAPRFIFNFLHLSSTEFYWLFVPAVTGIITGSAVAMRSSGRFTDSTVLCLGFGIMMLACIVNNAMNAVLHYPQLP